MRVLVFSSLFPNEAQPGKGLFVQARLRQLLAYSDISATVVAPVPWFPFRSDRFGKYGEFARVPSEETQYGIQVLHPRYPVIPKIGMSIAPRLMARALLPTIRRLHTTKPFDLIDAHYVYPDGVAATLIARELALPNTITARGTDIAVLPRYRSPRKQILRAIRECGAVIAVSESLKREIAALGADQSKITVLRNGVDLDFFRPREVTASTKSSSSFQLLSVGSLIEVKRHYLAIETLALLPECRLKIAGSGPLLTELRALARDLGVEDRLELVGQQSQQQLVELYNEAQCSLLMSSREGMANVILESLACGTPVVATDVGGAGEVLSENVSGRLVNSSSPADVAHAVRSVIESRTTADAVRSFAERYSWEPTSRGQLEIFSQLVEHGRTTATNTFGYAKR